MAIFFSFVVIVAVFAIVRSTILSPGRQRRGNGHTPFSPPPADYSAGTLYEDSDSHKHHGTHHGHHHGHSHGHHHGHHHDGSGTDSGSWGGFDGGSSGGFDGGGSVGGDGGGGH